MAETIKLSPAEQEKNLIKAENLYQEYLEKINTEEMTIDEALEDIEKKFQEQQINEGVKDELEKKLKNSSEQ